MDYADNRREMKEGEILRSCQRSEKTEAHQGDGNTNCSRRSRNCFQRFGNKILEISDQKKNRGNTDHNSVKICSNTQKITGDLKRLPVTKTPKKDH